MNKDKKPVYNIEDFVPDLREAVEEAGFDLSLVPRAALPVDEPEPDTTPVPAAFDRGRILLAAGECSCLWEVESLRALFRGDRKPPVLGAYPEEYNEVFMTFDVHILQISKIFGDPRDEELREIFSMIRRRPDGRSLGYMHDYLWQAAALVLGVFPLSQAEFEAIVARMERSCRTFSEGVSSRNFASSLRTHVYEEM